MGQQQVQPDEVARMKTSEWRRRFAIVPHHATDNKGREWGIWLAWGWYHPGYGWRVEPQR